MTSSDPSSIPDKFNHIWPTGMSEEDICIFIYYFFHLKKKNPDSREANNQSLHHSASYACNCIQSV
jgi:hypothetical protein